MIGARQLRRATSRPAMAWQAAAMASAGVGPPIWSATTVSVSRSAPSRSMVRRKFCPRPEKTQEVRRIACTPPAACTARSPASFERP
jgi:hypothetical protein